MPAPNYALAIRHWWEHVEKQGGMSTVTQPATVSTMLFACRRWLDTQADRAEAEEVEQMKKIESSLEAWMEAQGRTYLG